MNSKILTHFYGPTPAVPMQLNDIADLAGSVRDRASLEPLVD
jgi:hypothetical protein